MRNNAFYGKMRIVVYMGVSRNEWSYYSTCWQCPCLRQSGCIVLVTGKRIDSACYRCSTNLVSKKAKRP